MNDAASQQPEEPNSAELQALIQRYKEAEAALETFFTGQVDAVLDPATGLPILLQEAQALLQAAEVRYRRLLSRNTILVFELAADGTTLFVNDAVFDLLDYTILEMLGNNWWTILCIGEQRHQLDELYLQFHTSDVTQYDLSLTSKSGATVIIELKTANRRKPDRTLDRILGIAVDVTEHRRIANELTLGRARLEHTQVKRMVELTEANLTLQHLSDLRKRLLEIEQTARLDAERADRKKIHFLSVVAHELRTPLASIKGFATTLLATDVNWEGDTQREFVAVIDEEADKLNALIDQLMDLGRLESGTLRVVPEPCLLTAIIGTAMAQLNAVAVQHRLTIRLPPDLPMMLADTQRIAGVLVNLVSNAARYSPAGTEITVSAALVGTSIQVDVQDQGPGIPVENRELVFGAFWQAEQPSVYHLKGMGLGLAIVWAVMTAHRGRIWVADASPGATISFTLPIVPAD